MIRIDSWFKLRSRVLEEMLLPFLFSGIWALLIFALQKFYKNDLEYNSCVNSFIHTFAVCRGCEPIWYIEGSTYETRSIWGWSKYATILGSFTEPWIFYLRLYHLFSYPGKYCVYHSPFYMHCQSWVERIVIQRWARDNFYPLVLRTYRTMSEYTLLSRAIEIQIISCCNNKWMYIWTFIYNFQIWIFGLDYIQNVVVS